MRDIARIIGATDFSPAADRAVRRAASVASSVGAVLQLVHVLPPRALLESLFPPGSQAEVDSIRQRAEQALQERARRSAAQLGVSPACQVLHGFAHQAILEAIESANADLVVLGAQGEHEGALRSEGVGGTALKVAGLSRIPTLLVRREPFATYSQVMCCASGESTDRALLEWAEKVSPADLIHLASAYSVPYERRLIDWGASQATIDVYAGREHEARTRLMSDLIHQTGLHPARVRVHVERGDTLETLLRTAAQWQADLVIIGRRARAGTFAAGPLSSISRRVALRVASDVLVVPPPEGPPAL